MDIRVKATKFCRGHKTHHENPGLQPQPSQLPRLRCAVHSQPLSGPGCTRGDFGYSVAVRICFDHRKQGGFRADDASQQSEVVINGAAAHFDPLDRTIDSHIHRRSLTRKATSFHDILREIHTKSLTNNLCFPSSPDFYRVTRKFKEICS